MTPSVLKALLWMTGAITSFTLMAVAGRAVSFELDTFEIMLYRSLIGIVVVFSVASAFGTLGQVSAGKARLHLVRNLFHFTGQNLWFYALTVIPLAQVFALEFTNPIWVLLLSPFLLGERMTRVAALAACLGFVGILIVTRPSPETLNWGVAAAAVAAFAFALTAIFTRKLTRTESITCIMVWLTVTQAVFGLICAGYDGDIALPSAATAPWIVAIGIAGLTAHFCLTSALAIAPAPVVMPIDFLRLPVIMVVDILFYEEAFDILLLLGASLIFAGNWLNLTANRK